ncbi:MAG: hypothetical protein IPM37_17885 [Hahellaceae bacterium]|nr:hypothetical protein [Hahellaceae bacterium]
MRTCKRCRLIRACLMLGIVVLIVLLNHLDRVYFLSLHEFYCCEAQPYVVNSGQAQGDGGHVQIS